MTLYPFIMGSSKKPSCFDEKSPCILEQTSICVIDVAQKKDPGSKFPGQKMIVPWLSCMDSNGDKTDTCHKQVGIDPDDVKSCLNSDVQQLLKEYIVKDKHINETPTVHINGKKVKLSFKAIKKAICAAEPSLAGCSSEDPSDADWEAEVSKVPSHGIVVV